MAEWTNRLAGKTYTQGFDVENRLITVTVSSGAPVTTTFAYDATGQRTQTISYNSSTSRAVTRYPFPHYEVEHQQQWQYSCDNDPCGYMWVTTQTTPRTTYFLAGQAIATRVSGTLYYLHTDHLGSTSLMSNSSGYSVSGTTARYLPYGERRTTPTTHLTERGYTGHHENRDIGLTYMNARYYIPGLGRFLTADTIVPAPANPQSHNRYSYVLGNPLVLVDPTGHASCYVHGQNEHCTDDTPITPPPPRPQRPAARPVRDIPQCEGCLTPREVAIAILRSRFALPFAGTRSLTSSFGPDHPTGVDWGGQFTVLAPAAGTVTRAGSDGTAGMWRIQNIETGEIREYSVFSTATHGRLRLRDRDEHGLVEPERLLATGKWVDLEPDWSHVPGTQVTIDHGNGVETVYHHLTIDASIQVGVQV